MHELITLGALEVRVRTTTVALHASLSERPGEWAALVARLRGALAETEVSTPTLLQPTVSPWRKPSCELL